MEAHRFWTVSARRIGPWRRTRFFYLELGYSNFACLPFTHTMPVCSLELNPNFS